MSVALSPDSDHYDTLATAELVADGLHWLHDTVQPDTAIIDGRGAAALVAASNRIIRWVPLGWGWTAGVVIEVAHVHWGLGMGAPLNPMPSDDVMRLTEDLRQHGSDIADIRCTTIGLSAALSLQRPAHPTLCAAVRRHMSGCPLHHSRICDRPESRGGHRCTWYREGQRGVIWPHRHRPTRSDLSRRNGIEGERS